MKRLSSNLIAAGAAALLLSAAGTLAAADHGSHGAAGADHSGHGAPAAAAPAGVEIRAAEVSGYRLTYRLLNWEERNVAMKGMLGMEMAGMDNTGKATHHLVLHLATAAGTEVSGAKVGYQITGPDGKDQKTLTMAMGGYGADVILKAKGKYTVKTKVVDGSKTVVDTFAYEVK